MRVHYGAKQGGTRLFIISSGTPYTNRAAEFRIRPWNRPTVLSISLSPDGHNVDVPKVAIPNTAGRKSKGNSVSKRSTVMSVGVAVRTIPDPWL